MTASVNRRYIPEVDQLRAFAAIFVLFYHGLQLFGAPLAHGQPFNSTRDWLYSSNPLLAIIEEGHSGVALFIVLSGFILTLGAAGNTVRYGKFLIARILRIYPLLIAFAAFATFLGQTSLDNLLTSVLPLNIQGGIENTFAYMFWAVAVEFQCYLIFPFLIAFSNQSGSTFLVRVVVIAIVLRTLAMLAEGASPRDMAYWTVLGRIDQFCIGMIAARIYINSKLGAGWFAPAALAAGLMLYLFNYAGGWPPEHLWKILWPDLEGVVWACFIVTYIAAGRLLPHPVAWAATKLGEISYSTYLVHFAVIKAITNYAVYVRISDNPYYNALLTTLLLALPATVVIAALTYSTIELPFLRMRPKYIDRGEPAAQAQTS